MADLYQDDVHHPIPRLKEIDLIGRENNGSVMLLIIIASPLLGDERSQRRLLKKVENYLEYIASEDFSDQFGQLSSEKVSIDIKINPESDELIFELLKRCEAWVQQNNARLTVGSSII